MRLAEFRYLCSIFMNNLCNKLVEYLQDTIDMLDVLIKDFHINEMNAMKLSYRDRNPLSTKHTKPFSKVLGNLIVTTSRLKITYQIFMYSIGADVECSRH